MLGRDHHTHFSILRLLLLALLPLSFLHSLLLLFSHFDAIVLEGYLEQDDHKEGRVHEDDDEVKLEQRHRQCAVLYEPNRLSV